MVWIFGYGSLIWKVDFPTIRKVTGYVEGFYRTMEWADEVHRGVPGQQSRTAAIFRSDDPTARVWGVAYEISQDYWDRVLEAKVGYRERGGYGVVDTIFHPFDSTVKTPGKLTVTLFLGDKSSPYFKPGTIEELANHIVRAVGASGTNLEYLYSTAESLRMILPPGETDHHMFDLEAAAKKLEALEKAATTVKETLVFLEEKYEKRRDLLLKIYKASDKDMNRQMALSEFYDLAVNKLNLNANFRDVKTKFEEIDVNKDGRLSTKEFIDYFLLQLQENENKFKEEYRKFGMKIPEGGQHSFENALLMYEIMNEAGLDEKSRGLSVKEMLQENKDLVERMRIMTRPDAREVLEFFFADTITDAMSIWFGKSRELDAKIKNKFAGLVEQAIAGELDDWINTPTDCLALTLLLNQFPRNIWRNTPKMYSGDCKAHGVALKAIFYGYWKSLTPLQIIFMPCMVLATAENLHFQELGVQIWVNYIQSMIPPEDPLRVIQDVLKRNYEVIKKFGRFPHRNQILGRQSTPAEVEFLRDSRAHLHKPLVFDANGFSRQESDLEDSNPWPELDFTTKIASFRRDP